MENSNLSLEIYMYNYSSAWEYAHLKGHEVPGKCTLKDSKAKISADFWLHKLKHVESDAEF